MKSYLRYEPARCFGVITSPDANAIFDFSGNLAITPALNQAGVWNLRQASQVRTLQPEASAQKGDVTALARSPDRSSVAVGYSTGDVRIFNYLDGTLLMTLKGHRSGIGCLMFDEKGTQLASGGKDTDIILWDLVGQAGMFRLRGHRDMITSVAFVKTDSAQYIISSSKDTLLKVWDMDTQHCVQTIVGHRSEIWTMAVDPEHKRVVTGSSDNQLRFYRVDAQSSADGAPTASDSMDVLHYMGSVVRQSSERCGTLEYSHGGHMLACQAAGKMVELFVVRNDAEVKKRIKRRLKRAREKARNAGTEIADEGQENESQSAIATDEVEPVQVLRFAHKVRSFSFAPNASRDGATKALVALHNNALELWNIPTDKEPVKSSVVELQGHRSDIRGVAVSADGRMLATTSSKSVKIWNCAATFQCIRSTECGFGLCVAFGPADRHVIVGTKEGRLQVIDIASGEMIADIEAHAGEIWSLDVRLDGKGVMTGSADREVKFWSFEIAQGNLTLTHTRTLKMSDDVLAVRYTPTTNQQKLCVSVALLDHTVKVFYDDSLSFFLSLYGHKLPVMSLDISDDGTLLISGSADKTIKIWGMDFGDCHRSLLGHTDSVMCVRFVPKTHYFFSCSKDGSLKYWDADRFEQILHLPAHQSEAWSLAVSPDSSMVISGGHDRSIRVWERTEDLVFIEEEKERELEAQYEKDMEKEQLQEQNDDGTAKDESALATRRTMESLIAGERLIEALDLADNEQVEIDNHNAVVEKLKKEGETRFPSHRPNPLLYNLTPIRFVLYVLRAIKGPELEQALLILPFVHVCRLISYLVKLLKANLDVELCVRVSAFLLSIHQTQIVATHSLLEELDELRNLVRQRVDDYRNRVGLNRAGLTLLKRSMEENKTAYLRITDGEPTTASVAAKKTKRRRKNASQL